jgi:hypothetical protein
MKTKTKTIYVTKYDIEKAIKTAVAKDGSIFPNRCPVANAINRTFKKNRMFASVFPQGTNAIKVGQSIVLAPSGIKEFTDLFDAREYTDLAPFAFTLKY